MTGPRVVGEASGRRLRLLLASSSVAALLVGGGVPAFAQCAVNDVNNSLGTGPISNSTAINCINVQNSTVNGSVTNAGAGVITPSGGTPPTKTGITIDNSTIGGTISNAGTITMGATGIKVDNDATVSAGISNSGTISARIEGIFVGGHSAATSVSTFAGGISNGGLITVSNNNGIRVDGVSNFAGDITNSGSVSASGGFGIFVGTTDAANVGISTFAGNISNSGTISSRVQIGLWIDNVATFIGNVSNSGTISSGQDAIAVTNVTAFNGGISNSGAILTPSNWSGIAVQSVLTFSGGITNSGTISVGHFGIFVESISTFLGGITNSGTISAGPTGIAVNRVSTFVGNISNSGTISSGNNGIVVSGSGIAGASFMGGIVNSNTISVAGSGIVVEKLTTFAGGVSNSGSIASGLTYSVKVANVSNFSGGITNSGVMSTTRVGIVVSKISAFSGNISNSGTIAGRTGIVVLSGVTFAPGSAIVNTGTIAGSGGTAIKVSAATSPVAIEVEGGAINGNMVGAPGKGDTVNFALGSGSFTYADTISGMTAVNVNSGTLFDGGAISAGSVNVNSGGVLAPGLPHTVGTLSITGDLVFASAAVYLETISGANAGNTAVTGTATLGGASVQIASGSSVTVGTKYTILTDTGDTLGGANSFNPSVTYGAYTGTLTYDADDVYLTFAANNLIGVLPPNAPTNVVDVANAIDNYSNSGGTPPAQFLSLFNLAGTQLVDDLLQFDGEDATGAESGAFQLMSEFLNLMLDSSSGEGEGGGGALGFSPDRDTGLPPDIALAYASILKAPPPASFDRRWTTWGSVFGAGSSAVGNAASGSNTLTANDYGFAGGMDYHVDPATLYGFAVSGAGTNWGLAQGLGSGRSDAFAAGVYAKHYFGPAYVSAAFGVANHWFSTTRTALGEELTARFQGQSYGARFEGGYRYALPGPAPGVIVGVTPYAALQTQWFSTPAYSETGGVFALAYNAMCTNDTRSELGARFDALTMFGAMPLMLRGRLAWAHDWVNDPSLRAAFEALPGSTFTVFGAPLPHDSALASAGAKLKITAHWSALAKFDGEFASGSQTYSGTGALRYTW